MISRKWCLCLAAVGIVISLGMTWQDATRKDFENAARETKGCRLSLTDKPKIVAALPTAGRTTGVLETTRTLTAQKL